MDYTKKIGELVADRKKFEQEVYTPLNDAIVELKIREKDKVLEKKVCEYLNHNVPEPMSNGGKAVIFRQLVTPNYEICRFMCIPDATDLVPVFWEYYTDKFTPNNPMKLRWGKMGFHFGIGKKGGKKTTYENIIDFNKSNGKKISEVNTLWGQNLKDFHHELLSEVFPKATSFLFDASDWFHANGNTASEYYKRYMALFIRHGILFENFVLENSERPFIKEKFLPAFYEVWDKIGKKPLIVALEPTEIEGDDFWMHHPAHILKHVEKIKKRGYNKTDGKKE
jgi:hypothetical protein